MSVPLETYPELDAQVYVRAIGPEGAPPMVLIHGLAVHGARDFDPILPALSRDHRVLTIDLPGFGRSPATSRAVVPAYHAELVHAVIARHFGTSVDLIGHSMGAAIAASLAAAHPEDIRSLALLDMAGVLHYRDYLRTIVRAERPDDSPIVDTLKEIRQVLFEIGYWPVQNAKLETQHPAGRAASSVLTAGLSFIQQDIGPALRQVRAPVFVGWGRHDTIAPLRTAETLRFMLRPTAFQVFEHSGHAPMRTEPEVLTRALRRFVEAPAAIAPPSDTPLDSVRVGRCERERDRVFEGDYARIEIRRCKQVMLRNVRTRALDIDRSEVELSGVVVRDAEVGVFVRRSELRWSGGSIAAEVCIDTSHSRLNLLGLTCTAEREALRVRTPGTLVASASLIQLGGLSLPLHDEYELFPTPSDAPADPRAHLSKRNPKRDHEANPQ